MDWAAFPFHDLHVHTRPHSPDAHWLARLPWMLRRAARNGIKTVGLANHYFLTTNFRLFGRVREAVARHQPPGLQVLVGAELCVLNQQGQVKLTLAEAAQLDFVLAGPHHFKQRWVEKPCVEHAAAFVAQQHRMLLHAARHPLVNGLAHPWMVQPTRLGLSMGDFLAAWGEQQFAELGAVASVFNTALEIGMGLPLVAHHQGEPFLARYLRGLQAARAAGARFYFGSDAHHLHVVGRLDWLRPTLSRLGFTPADIINPHEWLE